MIYERIRHGYYNNTAEFSTHKKDPVKRAKWDVEEARRINKFRSDCAKECGVYGHPKEPILWRLAWDHGHASGLGEVWTYYQEFSELIAPEK